KMDYFENTGNATAELRWRSASTPKAIVPQNVLYPTMSSMTTVSASADATVRDGSFATTNYGSDTLLKVKSSVNAGATRLTYVKFDLNAFSSVSTAKLRLFGALDDVTGS